ncbi:hypothetical protein DRP05_04015 [Archaeoglobales archaeon]|nr:MAG: hypothetical protein DRP05_04015 [Archaeoglobales archaeon]
MIDKLKKLGLSEYEAKVYVSLVGIGKATAREVHEVSGVPRARVYDVLNRLTSKGFVDVEEGEPKRFKPVEPRKVIEKLKLELIKAADDCIIELESLRMSKQKDFSPALVIRGEWNILEKIRDAIFEAEEEILIISANSELILSLHDDLRELKKRVVCVLLQVDDSLKKKLPNVEFRELVEKDEVAESYLKGIVVDGVRVRMGAFFIFDSRKSIAVIDEGEDVLDWSFPFQ